MRRVQDRLGLRSEPSRDAASLRALYRAWCLNLPFDNISKLISISSNPTEPFPGMDAAEFFSSWLEHGTGGTCWTSSNALHAFASSMGFCAFRSTGSMWDRGVATHGTVTVEMDGKQWLIDSSILTMNPIPLEKAQPYIQHGPLHPVEVEFHDGSFVLWFEAVNHSMSFPCRLLERHVVREVYGERYEASRAASPFNERLFVRRNFPDRLVMLIGNKVWERAIHDQTERLLSADELLIELTGRLGYSGAIIGDWVNCGGLEAAMSPQAESPTPPPPSRVAPSLR
jgi:N-hydroxyarylamine O-acetyltransferase